MKLETQNSYITNPQFVGGVEVTPISGSAFDNASADNPQFGFVAGGLYVGSFADLTVKTYDGSVLGRRKGSLRPPSRWGHGLGP